MLVALIQVRRHFLVAAWDAALAQWQFTLDAAHPSSLPPSQPALPQSRAQAAAAALSTLQQQHYAAGPNLPLLSALAPDVLVVPASSTHLPGLQGQEQPAPRQPLLLVHLTGLGAGVAVGGYSPLPEGGHEEWGGSSSSAAAILAAWGLLPVQLRLVVGKHYLPCVVGWVVREMGANASVALQVDAQALQQAVAASVVGQEGQGLVGLRVELWQGGLLLGSLPGLAVLPEPASHAAAEAHALAAELHAAGRHEWDSPAQAAHCVFLEELPVFIQLACSAAAAPLTPAFGSRLPLLSLWGAALHAHAVEGGMPLLASLLASYLLHVGALPSCVPSPSSTEQVLSGQQVASWLGQLHTDSAQGQPSDTDMKPGSLGKGSSQASIYRSTLSLLSTMLHRRTCHPNRPLSSTAGDAGGTTDSGKTGSNTLAAHFKGSVHNSNSAVNWMGSAWGDVRQVHSACAVGGQWDDSTQMQASYAGQVPSSPLPQFTTGSHAHGSHALAMRIMAKGGLSCAWGGAQAVIFGFGPEMEVRAEIML